MGKKCIDLTGQKFGRLTVIKRAENKGGKVYWLCKCECGNEKVIRGTSLKSGATMSCGCLTSEKTKERWKDENFRKIQSEKSRERLKEQWKDENFKKMQSERMKELWENEDFKKMQSKKTKEQWENEEYRKIQSERMKEQWENEDFKKMQSKKTKEQWKDEDFKKMQSEKMKEQWKDENFKKIHSEKSSERMKELWQDEEMKWKMGYKGGISTISIYLRTLDVVVKWRNNCQYEANYICELSGKKSVFLNVHHLVAFSTIVIEAHNLHNIEIKPQVKDYTQEELRLLEEYVGSWHKDNSNAVVLSEDVHKLFHSLYGKHENTPEQFEEFRERYLAGEFKEVLK